jgi:DNA-binding MarR family transcriptional regulator
MKTRCIIGRIGELSKYLDNQVKNKIKEAELPILRNHVPLFYILSEAKEGMLFNEIVSIWSISKSSLSDIITKYEGLGYISKCDCTADKRSVYIHLTAEGKKVQKKLFELEDEIVDSCFKDFTEEEQLVLSKLIDKVMICQCNK